MSCNHSVRYTHWLLDNFFGIFRALWWYEVKGILKSSAIFLVYWQIFQLFVGFCLNLRKSVDSWIVRSWHLDHNNVLQHKKLYIHHTMYNCQTAIVYYLLQNFFAKMIFYFTEHKWISPPRNWTLQFQQTNFYVSQTND